MLESMHAYETYLARNFMSHRQDENRRRGSRNDHDSMREGRSREYDRGSRGDRTNERTNSSPGRRGSHRYRDSTYERRQYQERDRERERQKDRERYDRGRDGRYNERTSWSDRRSASPPSRSSKPRSPSQDRSPSVEKARPNFAQSGLLAAETNTVKAVDGTSTVLKYNEPPEARKPTLNWRLYVFKGSEQVGELSSFTWRAIPSLMKSPRN